MRSQNLIPVMAVSGLLLLSVSATAADTYGKGVTLADATPIAQLLGRPADFGGKTVRVEGVVTEVCTAMGCWMALAPEGQPNGSTVLIQVEHDGVIVFPLSAKGHKAAAQGVMEKIEGGEGREAAAELAAQQGAKAQVPAQWRIAATGAVVY
ncbi:MAG: hypothetical protein A3H97_24550 [Acidobacteria bacterium RIFCSPLOWO2_02_FULL_65_29]|nr:MAG: hypothetical protein A3H97_24550 [Acidobacteria bacterium RIFCSPLOWO2_02_FULL_65_29]